MTMRSDQKTDVLAISNDTFSGVGDQSLHFSKVNLLRVVVNKRIDYKK